jgi:tetratricopeptide (TPR) repeat protein
MPERPEPFAEPEADAPNDPKSTAEVRRPKQSIFQDPAVRVMAWVAALIVLLCAAGVVSMLYYGMLDRNPVPRTMVERNVLVAEQAYSTGPVTGQEVLDYVTALSAAGRYKTAQEVIDRTINKVDEPGGEITFAQAGLSLARKNYAGAIKDAGEAQEAIKAGYDAKIKKGGALAATARVSSFYAGADLIKATAYERMGDSKRALESYDAYLKAVPTDVSVLVTRANLRIAVGDVAGAKTDFGAALKYVPDNQEALDGLKRIGADR